MSAIEDALAAAHSRHTPTVERVHTAAPHRLPVYVLCTLVVLTCACLLGEDLAWDTLHYHLYAGFSALHDRFSQDYFAAGPQSYFNPYVYAPFYVLVSAGLSPLAVSCLLALLQSTLLWLVYELAVCACPSRQQSIRLAAGACAVVLALLNPVLIYQIGSSYADITTAAAVVGGWLLLAHAVRAPRPALVVYAGLVLGCAAALKLTNAVHAVAAATLLVMLPRPWRSKLHYGLGYAASLGVGFALVAGPWAYRLTQEFGNPFFPLMNGVFRSPHYTTEPLWDFRFIPDTLAEALWRPFAMAQPDSMVHVEQIAPDVRYAALLLLLSALAARWLWRRRLGHAAPATPPADTSARRVLIALSCGLTVAWILWLSSSGNSRYFLAMASVTGVVLVGWLLNAFAVRTAAWVLAAIVGIQGVQLFMGTDYRSGALPWNHPWLQVDLPGNLASEANLYLTTGVQSNSFVAAYLPAGSGVINFDGFYALGSRGANGARIEALMRRYGSHVRVLVAGPRLYTDTERRQPLRSRVDDALERLGLRVDASNCATITVRGIAGPHEYELVSAAGESRSPYLQLASCAVIPAEPAHLAASAERQRQVDPILDRVEDACPTLFQPRRMQTQHLGGVWMRYYANTNVIAFLNRGDVKFLGLVRGADVGYLGRESTWAKASVPLVCGRRDALYFAKAQGATTGARGPTNTAGGEGP